MNKEDKWRITIPGNEAWRNVPNLNWNSGNRKVNLNANWDDNRNYNWACPVVVRRDCLQK